ncbi:MAG TPA: phosphomannomutase/phosphoglucomutase [Xanthomonadaceae bacterium]|nr:phosphomannomutase/phosphoglucomutase [Xanthomonadaceae bacterium]
MAKNDNRREAGAGQSRRVWLLLGALLLLGGAYLGWIGVALLSDQAAHDRAHVARDRLLAELAALPEAPRQAFTEALQDAQVVSAAENGDLATAAEALRARLEGENDAQVGSPDLAEAFAGDLAEFGFARLAMLHAAGLDGEMQVAFSELEGLPQIELAAPIRADGDWVGLGYARLPLLPDLQSRLAGLGDVGGFLAVRANTRMLAHAGDAGLAGQAKATAVPGMPMTVLMAAREPEGVLPGGALVHLGLALVLIVGGLGLAMFALRGRGGVTEPDETFAEAVAHAEPTARVAAPTAAKAGKPESASEGVVLDRSIFRAYDVRGIVGQSLDSGVARLLGQSIGTLMHEKGLKDIVVGRDGRLSGPQMSEALIDGLREAGCDVIDIGVAATPLVYFATYHLNTGSGVAVTGSHNPVDYNGFKIMVGGETLSGEAIQNLYVRIAENDLHSGARGGVQHISVAEDYVERVASDVQLERRLKVVVDAGNGVAGAIAPAVLEAIGAEVIPLFCEVDGTFPNHHPDPSDPDNLADLITFVAKLEADLGLALDGDGDRLGVVTRQGEIVYPDRVLMLFAQDVLSRNPGASVIYDVKCTGHLAGHILRHGGSPVMWKTGHSLIKAKMRETEAELAGEMSGHFFFRERWFGFDDGVYAAARLLEILAADERAPEEIFEELPKGVSTPELKVPMAEGEHHGFVERFRRQSKFEGAKVATIDGVRADWPDGWGLVRASNTTPMLVLRFDADDADALARIQEIFRAQLLALDPKLELPF